MKFWKLSIALFILALSFPVLADVKEEAKEEAKKEVKEKVEEELAEKKKDSDDYKTALVSGTDGERMEALRHFAKEKDKTQIPAIIKLLEEAENPAVASEAAITLGVIGEKGESTQALKSAIQSTENGDIVYASILALFNIHREDEKVDPTAKEAMKFAFSQRRQDPYVVDLMEKLREKFETKEENMDDSQEESEEETNSSRTNQPD